MTDSRPSRDRNYLDQAFIVARRATCARGQRGCILVDTRGRPLSQGYNGPASGEVHCIDVPCAGASYPPGQGLDQCRALHSEWNALILCEKPFEIYTCYSTHSPCITCLKMLANTSCKRIVFGNLYAHGDLSGWWVTSQADREWVHLL